MPKITVFNVRLTDDAGAARLDDLLAWRVGAVGVATPFAPLLPAARPTRAVNVVIEATGAAFADMPATLPVTLSSRGTNRVLTPRTLDALRLDVPKAADTGTSTTVYRLARRWDDLPFRTKDSVREVATVVRDGKDATADASFRRSLGFPGGRGIARLRFVDTTPGGTTTYADAPADARPGHEEPPAELVLLGGGLEVLEAVVPADTDREVVSPPARALVRSPADVWFYSGHGLPDGSLAIGPFADHAYLPWAGPADFQAAWVKDGNAARTEDMRMVVLNGCNVLNLDAPDAPGKEWAKLMEARGGHLTHLLGYAAKAPLDSGGGDAIAARIGAAIRKGDDPVKAWLAINADFRRWGAVAMDAAGFHAFNPTTHKPDPAIPLT
ncbi:hypothetical protein ABTY96_42460 [Streptomyces sp. NPDC096057]|uniref:hypothetical protein n=1 Tax=Streptomyces sp. NPDC096057 TaxID=3155543 RepID=UPI00332D6B38